MDANTFGKLFRLTTCGESHGPALAGIVDGCLPGVPLSEEAVQAELDRRKPGQGGPAATARREQDKVRLISGVFEGETTGAPIGFVIENTDQRSTDYCAIKDIFRPGHGDMTYQAKYGRRDYRGGGRASGRETACRVAGGAIAAAMLGPRGISVLAQTVELGGLAAGSRDPEGALGRPYFAADPGIADAWDKRVRAVKAEGETLGGVVEVIARGVPAGLGEPVFDKLDARLAYALMGVGAVKGVEIGSGFFAAKLLGGENNDAMLCAGPNGFASNNAGGVLAGIASGQELVVRAAVKPIASISKPQRTVTKNGEPATVAVGGRHDICAIPRIVPVLRAMVLLTLADFWLLSGRR
ncbi:MAG: chorismate synthase [Desulfovibrionaceae bacterium]|nr:chorismate synthase [Desulfovibrionaceae bacterium]MBF0512989.1 chorismate synthase [Desulfovibrionaceae bacterium]